MEPADFDLIQQYLGGNDESFELLVKRHERVAYFFAYRILKDESDASDAVQESFVKVWKNIKSFKLGRQFRPWLLSIVYNTVIDILRAKKRFIPFSSLDDIEGESSFSGSVVDQTPLPDELFSQIETKRELDGILSTISEDRKTIILMHLTDGLSFEEIANILGKSMNTVKSQYRRALLDIQKNNAPKE